MDFRRDKTLSSVPTSPSLSFLIAAANGPLLLFFLMVLLMKSNLGVPLTINQVRYVMNQEILSNGIATNGKTLPNTIL
jgi:hypothetical protein